MSLNFWCLTILGLIAGTTSQLVQERLENLKSNETFLQEWHDHIKLWRDDFSSNDFGSKIKCDTNNKTEKATHVHQLRPQDINIVAAMGASIVSGMGAAADSMFSLLLEYRGLSYADGGDGDSTQMTTIPNILKNFNPDVFGQSYRVAPVWYEKFSQLNVAVPGEKAENLKSQAKELVSRIQNVPFNELQWKLITINIGINDLCQFCVDRRSYPAKWIKNIKKGLDYLYSHLTHTFVNLVSLPSVELWRTFDGNSICSTFHKFECPCLHEHEISNHEQEFQALLEDLATKYHRQDFTVEVQPFWQEISFSDEDSSENDTDNNALTYMAPDCFHLSQRGHAAAARALWNNMLQLHGNKTREWNPDDTSVHCPDQDCPYLRTRVNSMDCQYSNISEEESSEETQSESESDEEESEETTAFTREFAGNVTLVTKNPYINEDVVEIEERRRQRNHTRHHHHEHVTRHPHDETKATREHHHHHHRNHTRHHHHRHTRQPSTSTEDGKDLRMKVAVEQSEPNVTSPLPWLIAGILGTIVIALVALLVVQNRIESRKRDKRPLTERSPLLAADEAGEQLY